MICPSCSHDNIAGVDTCEECGQSLSDEYRDWGSGEFQDILTEQLAVLEPRAPICVAADTSLAEVISLLKGRNVGCVLVTGERGKLIGIFTERDVLYRVTGLIHDLEQITVGSLMTRRPTTLKADAAIQHAMHLMSIHGFRQVPLVDEEDQPVGFVSFRDIVGYIEKNFAPVA